MTSEPRVNETYVATPGRRRSSRTSWSYFAMPRICSTSSGVTFGSYVLLASPVEYWTAFVRHTFPNSRSSDLTPALIISHLPREMQTCDSPLWYSLG